MHARHVALPLLTLLGLPALTACPHPTMPPADAATDAPPETDATDVTVSADVAPEDASTDVAVVDDVQPTDFSLRAVGPLSTEVVTSRRPTFRWIVPDGRPGVVVEICADRACAHVQTTIASTATQASSVAAGPSVDLDPGVHYWRLHSGDTTTPSWELFVGRRTGIHYDGRTGWISDVNGDGLADIVVGASHANTEAGRAYVFAGSAHGVASTPTTALEGTGELAGHFGWWISPAGDVNGDGYGDIVVSAPDVASGTGAVMIFLGSATGVPTHASMTLHAPDPNGNFGAYVAGAGDVDGDGYGDIVVGAPNVNSSVGRAYVYLGSASGTRQSPAVTLTGTDGVGGTFGSGVAGVGDVNADGFADVVIGASGANSTAGRAYVFMGSARGIGAMPSVTIETPSPDNGQFGASVAPAGDVNGDGFADVVIGASGTLSGDAWIYHGGVHGLAATPSTALASPDGVRGGFGWAVASGGDVNGDGFDDVVIGSVCAPFHADPDGGYPTCGSGRIHVYNGSASGVATTPSASIDGPTGEPAAFGWALSGAGDLDGDGYGDVVVGAESTQMFAGSAFVYGGSASGLVSAPRVQLMGPDGPSGNFGWSVSM